MLKLSDLPKLDQRQDSLNDQLADLRRVANRLGMYDAADAMTQLFKAHADGRLRYGCHIDLDPGMEPDGCVIDEGLHGNCVHAKVGMRKEQCDYWRLVTPRAEGSPSS